MSRIETVTGRPSGQPGAPAGSTIPVASANAFVFVMASGLLAAAARLAGWRELAAILLAVALGSFAALVVLLVWRAAVRRPLMHSGPRGEALDLFAIVAAIGMVAAAIGPQGPTMAITVLALVCGALWLGSGYLVPAWQLLGRADGRGAGRLSSGWFLWVVAAQSAALAAGLAAGVQRSSVLAALGVLVWCVGLALLVLVAGIGVVHVVHGAILRAADAAQERGRRDFSPARWRFLGALAATALAGSELLGLPGGLVPLESAMPFLRSATEVLWVLSSACAVLLVTLEVWRHVVRRAPLRYHAALWNAVFALGALSLAGLQLAQVEGHDWVRGLAVILTAVALASWGTTLTALAGGIVARLVSRGQGLAR